MLIDVDSTCMEAAAPSGLESRANSRLQVSEIIPNPVACH